VFKNHGFRIWFLVMVIIALFFASIGLSADSYSQRTAGLSPSTSPRVTVPPTFTPTPIPTPVPTAVPTATPTPTPVPTPTPTPSTDPALATAAQISEARVSPGTEPTMSVDPETGDLAVAVQEIAWPHLCSRSEVFFSHDGGKTWKAGARPWGSGCQDIHAVIAWGPNHRLWAGDAIGVSGGVKMTVTYSDNDGASWASPYVTPFTPPWVGCFPMITVDNDPQSPSFGTVYAAYNWKAGAAGPGLKVLAKPLDGKWTQAEVPVVGLKNYPDHNRIGYRLMTEPNGLFVSWYESDLKYFDPGNVLEDGSSNNVGRRGFGVAELTWVGETLVAGSPGWAVTVAGNNSLIYDPRWQDQLALLSGEPALVVENGGKVTFGQRAFSEGTETWTWQTIAAGFKPVLAISPEGLIFVGWHAGSPISNYFVLSSDGGHTWTKPRLVDNGRGATASRINGNGLRENAVYGDGAFYWAFGDTRNGTTAVFVARIAQPEPVKSPPAGVR
jgi:hypothetical protein